MDRRRFLGALATAGAGTLAGCRRSGGPPLPPGELRGTALEVGHLLRDARLAEAVETRKVAVLIVGAGVGGLSAAWKLARSGFSDFLIVDLEDEAGGNSRAGRNAVSAYPWGAHYLPLPTREATAVRELLAELGVLEGDPRAARPVYDERYLCATPQERLYLNGRWQEGLLPQAGVDRAAREQIRRFAELVDDFRHRRDASGRRAFALPMDLSSRDAALLALDRVSMRDWLLSLGLDLPQLHWYVNHACRDDYGADSATVSAWAGIHYFACRDGEAANAAGETVLTAPEGNAWLVRGMLESIRARAGDRLLTGALAHRVLAGETRSSAHPVAVDLWLPTERRTLRVLTAQLIWAAPVFLVPRIFAGRADLQAAARGFTYAPWLIANLTLSRLPVDRAGAPPAWDNVLHDSAGLGYVIATHQAMRLRSTDSVWTWYRALDSVSPQEGRAVLRDTPREVWAEEILADLERPHPDIRQVTTRLDVYRNGHAMVRPLPGLIWGDARQRLAGEGGDVLFAHADLSGFSLFEEAQYRGVLAAERTLRRLGVRHPTSLR
ncbi:NAD(P)-binding protein [Accumulibacter sp.]|uniref:NAD(P)-binding protein n=1 Tax=Accumulibacter sp. TaxID=2053492 RepID=UPI0025FD08AC|nr:NAD(P)-binding protein [Accumulibacter sp.]MCM8596527.1 NAD(P)-binding protein [Accumulibacter sp.]MCM8626940.1 NAD(P)-binding protein [Accumulibacter sp.]MDS4050675.1 NAD(P)-binding protein [Accumulibacter sp.]